MVGEIVPADLFVGGYAWGGFESPLFPEKCVDNLCCENHEQVGLEVYGRCELGNFPQAIWRRVDRQNRAILQTLTNAVI